MEFVRVVRTRHMTRSFSRQAVSRDTVLQLLDLAVRAPSAGKTQGWSVLVLEGDDVKTFWNLSLPEEKREQFSWPHLLDAPIIMLPFARAQAYVDRYAEPDKTHTGLGESADAWPTPYWTIDTSFAVMTLLLGAHDMGLGTLFFAVFNGEKDIRTHFGVPENEQLIGAIALGWPSETQDKKGRSASRKRLSAHDVAHFGSWN
ncbi:MAG: nitroreductase family protein [Actinomycetes bacterium]